jgi:hypothetical protein
MVESAKLQPVTVLVIALSGNPIRGAQVEMTAGQQVVKGDTDGYGAFTGNVPIQTKLDIWVRRRGTNLGYGNGIWFHAAALSAAQRMTTTPITVTVQEHTPSKGMGSKPVGTTDLWGWVQGAVSQVNQVIQTIPVLSQINTAGAQTAAAAQQAGAQVSAAAQQAGRQTAAAVQQAQQQIGAGAQQIYQAAAPSAPVTPARAGQITFGNVFTSAPPTVQPKAQPAMNFNDLFGSLFGTTSGTKTVAGIPTIVDVGTIVPESPRDVVSGATSTQAAQQALADLQAQNAAIVKKLVASGANIPAEQMPSWVDILTCGTSAACVQAKYNTMNAGRNAAIKLWQQSIQQAATAGTPPINLPGPAAPSFQTAINSVDYQFTINDLSNYSNQSGIGMGDIQNAIIAYRNVTQGRAASIDSRSASVLNALGVTSLGGSTLRTLDIDTPGSTGTNVLAPATSSPLAQQVTANVIPGGSYPPGVTPASIQQSGSTLVATDQGGNTWTKWGKGDWHLVQGPVTTPEGVIVGGFQPATVSGYYSGGGYHPGTKTDDVGVVNPVTGQMWSGNANTMATLVADQINPPVTTRDGVVVSTCQQLASADPLRRQGAAWTQCDANQAWRKRFLYTSDSGAQQSEAIQAAAQNQAATATNAIAQLQALQAKGEPISMYQKNMEEYQSAIDALMKSTPPISTPTSSISQVNVNTPTDISGASVASKLATGQRYTIYDIMMAGATRAP